ncbi:MAG: organic solvent tolerance protein OstA, partial [Pirellulaceae bacterium]|nr:organic solvent tolerance protein OstA [Pirellulaceae bacterium]
SYEVVAFRGHCSLRQGELLATCDDLILWIERAAPVDPQIPRKYICTMEGNVTLDWESRKLLRDARWMGHLFSYQEVQMNVRAEASREDIPRLDWSRDPASAVVPAQYASPTSPGAPPLLPPNTLPANNSPGAAGLQLNLPQAVETLPGAVQWPADTGVNTPGAAATGGSSSTSLPVGGLVIPDDGSLPYPAGQRPLPPPAAAVPYSVTQVVAQPPLGAKLVTINQRSMSRVPTVYYQSRPESNDTIATIRGGVVLSITGVQVRAADGTVTDFGNVSIETDNAVMWIRGNGNAQPTLLTGLESLSDRPIELYLEGNIVLNQGQRKIFAEKMYYNVSSEYGMILSAEILTPVPQYQGLLRLKADVIEQRDRQNFLAYGAAITSSRLGVPRYWMQADQVAFEDNRPEGSIDNSRYPAAGQPTNMQATSRNNFVYLGGLPVTYWPIFTTNLNKPSFYLSSVKFKNDQIFGTQVFTEFDAYQLLGIDGPEGTDLTLSADYLSERGLAGGARFTLDRPNFWFAGPTNGSLDAWFINDNGFDTLGADRIRMTPEADVRGRALGRFRSNWTPNIEFWSELGYITDRNFQEQYFENEWDQQKDASTALRLRSYNGNRMFDIWGQTQVNDFFTETEWLPRLEHYWLGQDLGEWFSWSERTSVAYANQRVATTPTDPQDAAKFTLLPWETNSEGVRAITRQELSSPINLGAWKFTPFISGEAGYWGEDVAGDPLTRLTGQGGLRSSLPMWRTYPSYNSSLFDINGIAHKVSFENELFYADSSQDLDQLPLFDPLDDNAQEHFRRRMIFNTFGGARPERFEERNYALRQGMQRYVTASSSEIVDDMVQVRSGINQRLQTKRGYPGRERIVDLVSFDVDWIYYPKAERDNFGEDVGAINYDFRYHIGDRLTLLSDGYFDVFSQGLKAVSAGAMISRPGRGQAYLGILSLEGPISSNVLNGYLDYRLNEKWVAAGGAAWDFGSVGSIGQSLSLTRIGESALVQLGVNVDSGRDNVSFSFNIEPRFLPSGRIGTAGGQLITPAGLYGVE